MRSGTAASSMELLIVFACVAFMLVQRDVLRRSVEEEE